MVKPAWRISAHLRCTQCSIMWHLMDTCFLTCICLWQISQIQTFLFNVVGPGLVSTSPAFVSSSASHPAGPHGRYAHKTGNRPRAKSITSSSTIRAHREIFSRHGIPKSIVSNNGPQFISSEFKTFC